MSTDAKRAANARYLAKFKAISVRLNQEDAETIQRAADAAGESLCGYIASAAKSRAKRENDDKPKNP